MANDTRVITLDDFEHNLLINGFNEFRNRLIEEDEPTEDVDELLLKLLDAPLQKEKRHFSRDSR